MAPERSTPWYREKYIWICAAVALLGLGVVGQDHWVRQAKHDLLATKIEADQLYSRQQYGQAVARYGAMLAQAEGESDPELRLASEEARRLRDQAQEILGQEQARLAAEQAEQREHEEAVRQERESAEAHAEIEQSPEYQHLLGKAQEHEAGLPGVASRYYQAIVKQFPGTAQAKAAEGKARELWTIAYGNQDGSASAEGAAGNSIASTSGNSGGELCGAPLENGLTCRNRVKAGDIHCYLHSSKTNSSYGTHIGPRGGVYHYSKNGKKVYEKKR